MRKRADNQKGFTLIELLVVIAIVGVMVPVIGGSIFQIIRGTDRNNAKTIALADIENAAGWLNQDLEMAQTILVNENPLVYGAPKDLMDGYTLILGWTDYYGGEATLHQSQYYLSDTKLKRDYDGQVANIASYISEAEFSIDDADKLKLVTVTLTSSPESVLGRSETKTYRVYLRSEGG